MELSVVRCEVILMKIDVKGYISHLLVGKICEVDSCVYD